MNSNIMMLFQFLNVSSKNKAPQNFEVITFLKNKKKKKWNRIFMKSSLIKMLYKSVSREYINLIFFIK